MGAFPINGVLFPIKNPACAGTITRKLMDTITLLNNRGAALPTLNYDSQPFLFLSFGLSAF